MWLGSGVHWTTWFFYGVFHHLVLFMYLFLFYKLCWGFFRHPISLDMLGPLGAFPSMEGLETSSNSLHLLQSTCVACPCRYLLHRGGALHWESSMASLTARLRSPWFWQGVFVTLSVVLLHEELFGLPQALSELGRLDVPSAGIPSDSLTVYIDRQCCKTTVLLLLDGQLSLVL